MPVYIFTSPDGCTLDVTAVTMARLNKDDVRRANPVERVIPELLGEHAIEVGGELKTRCPFHKDQRPSLRINPTKQTWLCDPCHVGGDIFRFVEMLRNCDCPAALSMLAARACMSGNGHKLPSPSMAAQRPEREHVYHDEDGGPLYRVIIHGRRPDGTKIVSQERYEDGRWIGGQGAMKGVQRLLFRLPDLKAHRSDAVVVVEGEKDCDRLWAHGIPATTNTGGRQMVRERHGAIAASESQPCSHHS